MAYHSLSECTLTAEERRQEADRIIGMLIDVPEDKFTERENDFLTEIGMGCPVSVKQLFWLRDIKDRRL